MQSKMGNKLNKNTKTYDLPALMFQRDKLNIKRKS